MKAILRKISPLLVLLLVTTSSYAKFSILKDLPIYINLDASAPEVKAASKDWKKFCTDLKVKLTKVSKESTQQALFAKGRCRKKPYKSKKSSWVLTFQERDNKIKISLNLMMNKKSKFEKFLLVESKKKLSSILPQINIDNVMTLVRLWLPYWERVKLSGTSNDVDLLLAEKQKYIFISELAIGDDDFLTDRIVSMGKYLKHVRKGVAKYRMDSFYSGQSGIYYAARSYKKGQQEKLLAKAEKDLLSGMDFLKILDSILFGSLDSSLAGVRYGIPLVSGGTIISSSSNLSTMVEIRNGPLGGLRYYYDFAPEVTKTNQGYTETFAWSRWYFGWSYEVPLPKILSKFITKVDVVPKLGGASMNLDLVVQDGVDPLNISANNVFSTGIELGVEKDIAKMRLRLWGSYDFSGTLIAEEDSIKSLKAGSDLTYDLMEFKKTKLTLLTYLSAERLILEKGGIEGGTQSLSEVSFNLAYLGVGVALSW